MVFLLTKQNNFLSNQAEEYLEAIYRLEFEKGNAKTMDLVKELGVVPGSITNTIENLEKKGYVIHVPYKGVKLTKKGKKIALNILRKHRVAERFLSDLLDLPWSEVHGPACQLEHAFSNKILKSLEKKLNYPQICPHGNPIPKEDGSVQKDNSIRLTELKLGETAIVQRIFHEKTIILKQLQASGLVIDSHVKILKKLSSNTILLDINGKKKKVEKTLAKHVCVLPFNNPRRLN